MTLFTTIGFGFTGRFANYPDLQARFFAWFVFTLISLGAFTFDAWISYSVFSDYLSYIGSVGDIPGLILSTGFALAATVSVGVVAYAFVVHRRSVGKDQEGLSDNLRFAGWIASFLYLTFAAVSILANIQGAQQAAERHADSKVIVDDSSLTGTTAEWTAKKDETAARYDKELTELKERIAAIEAGTSKEQGRVNGKRGNVTWKGNLTVYGRSLLAELHGQISAKETERATTLAALDVTYDKRLKTENEAFARKSSRHSEKKEKATTAIRLIVFLIYPIALLIAIFNAHFLCDANEVLNQIREEKAEGSTRTKVDFTGEAFGVSARKKRGHKIGFKMPYEQDDMDHDHGEFLLPDFAQFQTNVLDKMERLNAQLQALQNAQPNSTINREILHKKDRVVLSKDTPYNLGKKYDLSAHQKRQLNKVNKAFIRMYKKEGKRPSYTALADACNMDRRTVSKYVKMIEEENTIASGDV